MKIITQSTAILTMAMGLFLAAGCGKGDAPTKRAKGCELTDEVYIEVMAHVLALGQKVPLLIKQGKINEVPDVTDAIDAVYAKHGTTVAEITAFTEKVQQEDESMERYRELFNKINNRINELRPEYGLPPPRDLVKEAEEAMRNQ